EVDPVILLKQASSISYWSLLGWDPAGVTVTLYPLRAIITTSDHESPESKGGPKMKKRLVLLCAMFALASIVAFAADVTGKWVGEANPNGKGGPPTFNFKQSGTTLTGTTAGRGGDVEISNGKV